MCVRSYVSVSVRCPSGPFLIQFLSSKLKILVLFLSKVGPKKGPSGTFGSKSEIDLGQRIIQILWRFRTSSDSGEAHHHFWWAFSTIYVKNGPPFCQIGYKRGGAFLRTPIWRKMDIPKYIRFRPKFDRLSAAGEKFWAPTAPKPWKMLVLKYEATLVANWGGNLEVPPQILTSRDLRQNFWKS